MAKRVLSQLKVKYEIREFDCGCALFASGKREEMARTEAEALRTIGGREVIVGCARCLYVLRRHGIRARHISEVVLKRVAKCRNRDMGEVCYHDPCFLSRYLVITEEPREVLRLLGYKVLDFEKNRRQTQCCGGYTYKALQRGASQALLETAPSQVVTSACTMCTANLKAILPAQIHGDSLNSQNSKIVKTFLELVDSALTESSY